MVDDAGGRPYGGLTDDDAPTLIRTDRGPAVPAGSPGVPDLVDEGLDTIPPEDVDHVLGDPDVASSVRDDR